VTRQPGPNLKASLANWMNRDDLSTTEIPEAIALCERRFNRALRVPEMEDTASASALSRDDFAADRLP
jgi:hypothetical protein